MTFTIEELEALKEGTTPAPWKPQHDLYATLWVDCSNICDDTDGKDADLAFLAPELLDALIAEKKAHGRLKEELGKLINLLDGQRYEETGFYEGVKFAQHECRDILTRILEGTE